MPEDELAKITSGKIVKMYVPWQEKAEKNDKATKKKNGTDDADAGTGTGTESQHSPE